jgi:histidyl-tRNA synthetase
VKPSIPKGTRDFGPAEMSKRNFIIGQIKSFFSKYGFQQIETPAMENLSTLTGKYGDEGDQLLFKILNSRIHESKNKQLLLDEYKRALDQNINSELLTERALRYDLTVPFARYVVMHQHEITFPFRRYQVQPVWRADRPQRGRYREFYQCDADIVGSNSLLNEADLLLLIEDVFEALRIPIIIKINNRKILAGIAQVIGEPDKITELTVAIDKLDKIGIDKVNEELQSKGFSAKALEQLQPLILMQNGIKEKLDFLRNFLSSSQTGLQGITEIEQVLSFINIPTLELDTTLARGLNYYTGAIIEVKPQDIQIGSITGGGRYDDLTGIFGLPGVSGVGISFGLDRIYDVMEEKGLFENLTTFDESTKVLLVNLGQEEQMHCLTLLKKLRKSGINAELYPDNVKLKKQMAYADSKKIPYVLLAGSEEITSGVYTLRNMISGDQSKLNFENLVPALSGVSI